MSKALIIAEKPSVANDIARALGGFTKHDEYYESDDYVLSSAVGHLLEIAAPEDYEVKRGKWSFANLPVIPPHFDLNPIAKSESRLKVLTRLLKRKDIEQLINAGDGGREGELIFRLIAQHAKAKQPVQRLWLQSMTPAAIRDGFARLRSDEEMGPRPAAETVVAACRGQIGTVTEESKPTTQLSPALFDLTSLQREANGRFGFSAKNTLGVAQALYEKHKVLTYPRTDSRALPEDYIGTVKKTLDMLVDVTGYSTFAD